MTANPINPFANEPPDGVYVRVRSEFITSASEAATYYAQRLVGEHHVTCFGRAVTIVFMKDSTHLWSEEREPQPGEELVARAIGGGRIERRTFSLVRARLMDQIVRAVTHFTVSIDGTGARGRENRMLHGPRLPSGDYLRVVLRPLARRGQFAVVSAYPVSHDTWMQARRARSARFPP